MAKVSTYISNSEDEPIIKIDSNLRIIRVPEELYEIGVVGDHYAETIYFKIPRLFDGDDLSTHTCMIEFVNALGTTGSTNAVDVTVNEHDIVFGWEIDKRVTIASGIIRFCVKFISTDDRGYQFTTTPAELKIKEGLISDTTVPPDNMTIIDDLKTRISELEIETNELNNKVTKTAILSAENENKLIDLKNRLDFITDNVVYTTNILEK